MTSLGLDGGPLGFNAGEPCLVLWVKKSLNMVLRTVLRSFGPFTPNRPWTVVAAVVIVQVFQMLLHVTKDVEVIYLLRLDSMNHVFCSLLIFRPCPSAR